MTRGTDAIRAKLEARLAALGARIDRIEEARRELLGPGLVTGVADDDSSGIDTHSQIGAAFGYSPYDD